LIEKEKFLVSKEIKMGLVVYQGGFTWWWHIGLESSKILYINLNMDKADLKGLKQRFICLKFFLKSFLIHVN
jgi:hypothetical protein